MQVVLHIEKKKRLLHEFAAIAAQICAAETFDIVKISFERRERERERLQLGIMAIDALNGKFGFSHRIVASVQMLCMSNTIHASYAKCMCFVYFVFKAIRFFICLFIYLVMIFASLSFSVVHTHEMQYIRRRAIANIELQEKRYMPNFNKLRRICWMAPMYAIIL